MITPQEATELTKYTYKLCSAVGHYFKVETGSSCAPIDDRIAVLIKIAKQGYDEDEKYSVKPFTRLFPNYVAGDLFQKLDVVGVLTSRLAINALRKKEQQERFKQKFLEEILN